MDSLQRLLLSYMKTVKDEVTTVGRQIAELVDSLASTLLKYTDSEEYHELTLTLLKAVSLLSISCLSLSVG